MLSHAVVMDMDGGSDGVSLVNQVAIRTRIFDHMVDYMESWGYGRDTNSGSAPAL